MQHLRQALSINVRAGRTQAFALRQVPRPVDCDSSGSGIALSVLFLQQAMAQSEADRQRDGSGRIADVRLSGLSANSARDRPCAPSSATCAAAAQLPVHQMPVDIRQRSRDPGPRDVTSDDGRLSGSVPPLPQEFRHSAQTPAAPHRAHLRRLSGFHLLLMRIGLYGGFRTAAPHAGSRTIQPALRLPPLPFEVLLPPGIGPAHLQSLFRHPN